MKPNTMLALMSLIVLLVAGLALGLVLQKDKADIKGDAEAAVRDAEIAAYDRGFADGMNATLKHAVPEGSTVDLEPILKEMRYFK